MQQHGVPVLSHIIYVRFQYLYIKANMKLRQTQIIKLTLSAGFASGWKTERALIALTSTPIGCASWGIACIMSCKTNLKDTFRQKWRLQLEKGENSAYPFYHKSPLNNWISYDRAFITDLNHLARASTNSENYVFYQHWTLGNKSKLRR